MADQATECRRCERSPWSGKERQAFSREGEGARVVPEDEGEEGRLAAAVRALQVPPVSRADSP